jgi:hypothetical protein
VPFILCFIGLVLNCSTTVHAQGITVYQYRRVDPAKMDEFLKRETTYWSKVAQKAVEGGKMSFWAVLAKVGASTICTNGSFSYFYVRRSYHSYETILFIATGLYFRGNTVF